MRRGCGSRRSKLYEAGEPERAAPRHHRPATCARPTTVFGDLSAQVSSGKRGGRAAGRRCASGHGLDDIELLVRRDHADRSEEATRAAIRALHARHLAWPQPLRRARRRPSSTLHAAVTIDRDAGEVLIDFTGSSTQPTIGINVVMNYTHAYATFAVRSCAQPRAAQQFRQRWRRSSVARARGLDRQLPLPGARSTRATSSACSCRCRS